MLEMHLRKLLWIYCARHTVVTGNDPVDTLVGREGGGGIVGGGGGGGMKEILTRGVHLGRSEGSRSFRNYLLS